MLPPSTRTHDQWPPNYIDVWQWRQAQVLKVRGNPIMIAGSKEYYRTHPAEFINHWVDTYDPRNAGRGVPSRIPLICFRKQDELISFLMSCISDEEGGLIEKARDMGATWICAGFSVWLWLFWDGAAIGWGSRKEQLVDRIGDADSIFEKMRMIIRGLPEFFIPVGFSERDHMTYMKFINPQNGATITGEAGDNIGRGGRKLIYFKDESAHYERPEKIEAALADNTRVPIDLSSVNGLGNVFHRRRENGEEWHPGKVMEKGRTRVFVMDWSDHPAKDAAWYEQRRKKAEADGLLHIFAQEVDRNYSAAVEGVCVPAEWVKAAIDAHIVLGLGESGGWGAALDVADGGGDRNALAKRRGVLLKSAEDWGARDTAVTARRAVDACIGLGDVELQYDCIGVGAGVKAEANNLADQDAMPKGVSLVAWNAAASPLYPDAPVVIGNDGQPDDDSPLNKDFYTNLKAQAWWELRLRFWRTFQWVANGVPCDPDTIISLCGKMPNIRQVEKELSQPTMGKGARLKLIIDKTPEGTKSPNLADAIAMCYWPVPDDAPTVGIFLKSRHR